MGKMIRRAVDVCWCYGVVRLGWCGILMQAEALVLQPEQYNP